MSHARNRVAGFLQFIRLIFFVYTDALHGALSTDDRGDGDGARRGVGRACATSRLHTCIKRPPPHRGQRGHLNTLHSAVLSSQAASVDLLVEPSFEVFAEFLLGFA